MNGVGWRVRFRGVLMNRQGWQMAGTEVLHQPPPVLSTFAGPLLLDIPGWLSAPVRAAS